MSATDPKVVKLAVRALGIVDRGASERSAVLEVSRLDPSLKLARDGALELVIGTLKVQDVLDRLIGDILPGEKLGSNCLPAFRVAAFLMLGPRDRGAAKRVQGSLRNIVQIQDLPILELLLGNLSTKDSNNFSAGSADTERLALETHHPTWWVEYCTRLFGRDEAIRMFSAPLRPRYIRVNPLRNHGRSTIPLQAKPMSTLLSKTKEDTRVYTLKGRVSSFSKYFSDGLFQMQDLASYLAVKSADPKPSEDVLDLCAAPGGKTATLAQFMKNRGRIVSVDYSSSRMQTWRREISRLAVEIAEPLICDCTRLGIRERFDLVVVDPPCTGTGILDRNPRMKWHLSPESLDRYSRIQRRLLDSAAPLVEEDGRILYCTCSTTVEENEQVVSGFLKSHPEFETRPITAEYGSPGLYQLNDCRRLTPHRDRTAGYFIARLEHVN